MCSVYVEKGCEDLMGRSKEDSGCGSNDLAKFLMEFNSKYYSQAVINGKVVEFTRLQQGSMLVLEYV